MPMFEKMGFDFEFKVPKILKSVRYCLAAVNAVFLITGFLLLIVSIAVLVQYSDYEELITKRFFKVTRFTLVTAIIILVGSGLGVYSAISEKFYFVAGFVALLLVTLIFEISIVIAAFSLSNDAVTEIRRPMQNSLDQYANQVTVKKLWDDLQRGYSCCGVTGSRDFIANQIPISCCHIDYGTISPFECTADNAYGVGCASVLGEWLAYNAHVLAVSSLVATCLQVLLTAMGGYLAYRSKFEDVELES